MNFYDTVMAILREAADHYGVVGLSKLVNVDRRVLTNWINGKAKGPSLDRIARVCDLMGYTPTLSALNVGEPIDFDMHYRPNGLMLDPKDYIAIPLVKDENLIDGPVIPQSNIEHIGPAHKSAAFVQGRTHLISIAMTDDIMAPLLVKDDYVIIDLDDREIEQGRLYLVRNPERTKTAVRRVFIDGDSISFYNKDHSVEPKIFSLSRQYNGDLSKAVLGRVIWGRIDLLNM